jgi:hypothetical protein
MLGRAGVDQHDGHARDVGVDGGESDGGGEGHVGDAGTDFDACATAMSATRALPGMTFMRSRHRRPPPGPRRVATQITPARIGASNGLFAFEEFTISAPELTTAVSTARSTGHHRGRRHCST